MVSTGGSFAIAPGAAAGLTFLIVESRYYEGLADALLEGAAVAFAEAGGRFDRITVPGALEIPPAIAMALASKRPYRGFVALGCVIRGETTHYDIVAGESARALMALAVDFAIPLGNGILTVENEDQAWERARISGQDKGGGAARAAIAMALIKAEMGESADG